MHLVSIVVGLLAATAASAQYHEHPESTAGYRSNDAEVLRPPTPPQQSHS